jgi:hypothetical protein
MKILAIEHESAEANPELFSLYAASEARKVWELHQDGIVRELYFRGDRTEAVLVLECTSVEEAQHMLGTLPLVQAGLITFEVIPLRAYSGFARLFA